MYIRQKVLQFTKRRLPRTAARSTGFTIVGGIAHLHNLSQPVGNRHKPSPSYFYALFRRRRSDFAVIIVKNIHCTAVSCWIESTSFLHWLDFAVVTPSFELFHYKCIIQYLTTSSSLRGRGKFTVYALNNLPILDCKSAMSKEKAEKSRSAWQLVASCAVVKTCE